MRWLLFLSKLAFVCNLAFLVSFLFRVTDWLEYHDIKAYIIIIGWVLGVIFNPLVVLCYLLFFLFKRKALAVVPPWVLVVNTLFLFLQLVFLLVINVDN
ncbi:MAG TPA: hypothetical protein VFP97_15120 [Chitinophagaceae bacterium]|nr:hypothetical protein [Chitinophagaceae bacterium]